MIAPATWRRSDDPDQLELRCTAIDARALSEKYLDANVNVSLVLEQLATNYRPRNSRCGSKRPARDLFRSGGRSALEKIPDTRRILWRNSSRPDWGRAGDCDLRSVVSAEISSSRRISSFSFFNRRASLSITTRWVWIPAKIIRVCWSSVESPSSQSLSIPSTAAMIEVSV